MGPALYRELGRRAHQVLLQEKPLRDGERGGIQEHPIRRRRSATIPVEVDDYGCAKIEMINFPKGILLFIWALSVVIALPREAMAQGPVVFWASTTVQPGETVLFYGDGLETTDDIRFLRLADEATDTPRPSSGFQRTPADGQPSTPLQPSNISVKVIIPEQLQPGVFVVWVHTSNGWSKPIFLNRPDPWWTQGDGGTVATPGGWIRVLGTNAKDAWIARNALSNGRWGWYSISGGERIIFERNHVTGGDLMSTGGGVNSLGGAPASQYIYFAHNTFKNLYGWDREAMTTDGGGGDYIGLLASATFTTVAYPSPQGWKTDDLKGKVAYVLSGKGMGQYRQITANTDRTLTLERSWDVVPDSTSVMGITWMRGHYLFIGNTAIDASIALQLYGVAFDSIVAENRSVRAGGFRSYAMRYLGNYNVPITQGIQPEMFVQYLNNEISEGSSYHMGSNSGSVVGVDASAPSAGWQWPMALGFVFRGNTLGSHARLRLSTPGDGIALIEDVIFENNRVQDSTVGIEIGARSKRVLLHRNHFTHVTSPVVDYSQKAEQISLNNE